MPGGRRPRIYVHIGEPKTGTTFLQRALWGNRARLAAQGILLPGYEGRDHNRASRDLREAPREAGDPTDPWAGDWDVLVRERPRRRLVGPERPPGRNTGVTLIAFSLTKRPQPLPLPVLC